MSTDGPAMDAPDDERVPTWRRLNRNLWVGYDGTASLGTIEHGTRYVFIDSDGTPRPGTRSLREAQASATGAIPVQAPQRTDTRSHGRVTARVAACIPIAAALLVAAACWIIGIVLLGG